MSPIRVLVVDDHALFRRGLVDVLKTDAEVQVVGEAPNAVAGLALADQQQPGLVLMDMNMPGQDGVAATEALLQKHPDVKVAMLTVSEDPQTLAQAMAAGASGYLLKSCSPREILEAVRRIAEGWVIIAPSMASVFLRAMELRRYPLESAQASSSSPLPSDLTGREEEILMRIARGNTNLEIATELSIAIDTVKSHVRSILAKFQARSRREVMLRVRSR